MSTPFPPSLDASPAACHMNITLLFTQNDDRIGFPPEVVGGGVGGEEMRGGDWASLCMTRLFRRICSQVTSCQ